MAEKSFLDKLLAAAQPMTIHFALLLLAFFAIWLTGLVVHHLFGEDGTFFDFLPVRYIQQFLDLIVLIRFGVAAWRDFKDA